MDRDKVIKGWECHMEADTLGCADCPYRQGWRTCNFSDTLFNDVYAMLKEQPEIVRCKDCKFWNNNGIITKCEKHIGNGYPGDWFCADGKKVGAVNEQHL